MHTRLLPPMKLVGIFILMMATTTTFADSDIGLKGIGPRLGFVDPEGGLDGTIEFGAAFEFGEFVHQLHWDGSVSYWSSGRDYQYPGGSRYDWSLSDFILRSGVNYHFIEGDWEPYAGGGLGIHFYSWDYSGSPSYNNSSDTKIALYIDGGIEHKFSYNWTGQMQVQLDFAEPDQTSLMFNLIYRLQ